MAETPPPPGYAADVPRPALGFSIDLPDHWAVLDLNPNTWDDWLDAFLENRLAGRATAPIERGPARAALLELLRRLNAEGVFLAGVLASEVGGHIVSASATLAWRHLAPGRDSLPVEGLRQIFLRAPATVGEDPAARQVEQVELPCGAAIKVVSKEAAPVPTLTKLRLVAVTQYLVPVPEDGWLAVITTTTGARELEPGIEAVADDMANSLTFETASTSAEP